VGRCQGAAGLQGREHGGQREAIGDGAGTHTFTYTDAGQLDVEAHTAGPLAGWAVDHDYDTLLRRTDEKVKQDTAVKALTHYTYDDASRFHTIGDGTRAATYAYLTNRGLVEHITFHNGTADAMRTSRQYDALGRLTSIGTLG
jgi:YD repeat-containing protein